MYLAMNSKQEVVYANRAGSGPWTCPECQQALTLKRSKRGRYYFSHLQACGSGDGRRGGGEGALHLSVKHQMANNLQALGYPSSIEASLSGTDQRADLLVAGSLPFLIEYQHSPIDSGQVANRHGAYQALGWANYWFLTYPKERLVLDKWTKSMLNYHPLYGYHLWYWQAEDQVPILIHQLPLIYRDLAYSQTRWKVDEDWPSYLPHYLSVTQPQSIRHQLITQEAKPVPSNLSAYLTSLKKQSTYRPYINWFYQEGLTLEDLPDWVWNDSWQNLIFQEAAWVVRACLACLERQYGIKEEDDLRRALVGLIERGILTLIPSPLSNQERLSDFCRVYANW